METIQDRRAALFIDRACSGQWVVRDPDGVFWLVPSGEGCWEGRQPYHPTEETDLEPIPKHYLSLLDLPF